MNAEMVDLELSEATWRRLSVKLAELKAKGVRLKNHKLVKDENDVLTFLLDHYYSLNPFDSAEFASFWLRIDFRSDFREAWKA